MSFLCVFLLCRLVHFHGHTKGESQLALPFLHLSSASSTTYSEKNDN